MKNSRETIAALCNDVDKLTVTLRSSQDEMAALQRDIDKQTKSSQDKMATLQWNMDRQTKDHDVVQRSLQSEVNELRRTLLQKTSTLKDQTIFKVTGYHQKKRRNSVFNSPSFYSSSNGYYMYIRVHANGNQTGKGTHVSVYALLGKGDYDDSLKWPFVGDITITLLNQLEDDNHCEMTVPVTSGCNMRAGNGRGFPMFILHSSLGHDPYADTQYLKDDTLYFRVSVSVPKYKSWLHCTI